ncbi:hypothetical protein V5799_024761 [Amblyomma americanum]|uniref:Uncharacterized protein n=1 Tax=Amblyomma americanum TaxID=6943 RepID=A0AAQ4EB53_AMBAM
MKSQFLTGLRDPVRRSSLLTLSYTTLISKKNKYRVLCMRIALAAEEFSQKILFGNCAVGAPSNSISAKAKGK